MRSLLWLQEEAARNLVKLSSSDVTQGLRCIVGNAGKKEEECGIKNKLISPSAVLILIDLIIKMHRKRARKKTKTGSGM